MAEPGLSDDELRARIRDIKRGEEEISYTRRILHGRIDVVRSEILERIARRQGAQAPRDDTLDDLVARLTRALTHQGPPPIDAELEAFGATTDEPAPDAPAADQELPDLHSATDAQLAALVRGLTDEERRTSAHRQELHRELDQLRAEHVARLQQRYADTADG